MKYRIHTISLILFIFSCMAQAGLIELRDWRNSEDMVYVEDTQLEWLNTNLTSGLSFTDDSNNIPSVSELIADTGSLYGWRVATTTEVSSLFSAFRLELLSISGSGVPTAQDILLADTFINSLGDSLSPNHTTKYGSINFAFNEEDSKYYRLGLILDNSQGGLKNETTLVSSLNDNFKNIYGGFYLVRDAVVSTVPEPSTLAIFLVSLAVLFRKKLKSL